jgi:ABC-2 type transport system permease protein
MTRYGKIFVRLLRYSIINQMQYRTNFLMMLPAQLAWTMQEVLFAVILYGHTNQIWNWSKYEMLVLLGTYIMVDCLVTGVILTNLASLSEKIRTGHLDFFLVKPIDAQFLVAVHHFDLGFIYGFLIGLVLIVLGVLELHLNISLIQLVVFTLLVCSGFVVFASLLFCLGALSFKTTRMNYIGSFFLTLAQFSRRPFEVYPRILRHAVMFVVPVGFIAYVPAGYLLGKIQGIWGLSFLMCPLCFLLSRYFWQHALATYTSASS